MSRDPRNLRVFHDAHALTLEIYRRTNAFPREERFGLRGQMRRAAVSVAANIVEGSARRGGRDYERFLTIAFGSCCELQYLIALVADLKLVPDSEWSTVKTRSEHVARQLHRLMARVGASARSDQR